MHRFLRLWIHWEEKVENYLAMFEFACAFIASAQRRIAVRLLASTYRRVRSLPMLHPQVSDDDPRTNRPFIFILTLFALETKMEEHLDQQALRH
jgi:hypothetical protein